MLSQKMSTIPEMAPVEQQLWRDLIAQRCGLTFSEARTDLLRRALWSRMQPSRMVSYSAYYEHVQHSSVGHEEWQGLYNALTNRETSFFRLPQVFTALEHEVLPRLVEARANLSLWCAGCSTGQEAYSLAMLALRVCAGTNCTPRIYASDLSSSALAQAESGRFTLGECRGLTKEYRQQFCLVSSEKRAGKCLLEMRTEVKRVVTFQQVNLLEEAQYPVGPFEAIFCQNVLIYFSNEVKVRVAASLVARLVPGGYLFLAPTELVGLAIPNTERVTLAETLAFRRVD